MTYQLVKYKLNSDGTIPDFIYHGNDGINGAFAVYHRPSKSPQDMLMIGLTKHSVTLDIPEVVEIFESKQQLEDYLTEILSGKLEPAPRNPNEFQPIDIESKVNRVWEIYEQKNL